MAPSPAAQHDVLAFSLEESMGKVYLRGVRLDDLVQYPCTAHTLNA